MNKIIENKEQFFTEMREYYNGEEFNKKEYFLIKFFVRLMYVLTHELWIFLIMSIPSSITLIFLIYSFNSALVTFVFLTFHLLFYKYVIRKYFFKNMKKEHEEYRFILMFFEEMES